MATSGKETNCLRAHGMLLARATIIRPDGVPGKNMMWTTRRNDEAFMSGRAALMRRFGKIESDT
jgi:hypothetical protein